MPGPITYQNSGVNYGDMDPFKLAAQNAARSTSRNLARYFGYREVGESRGESAFVWDEGDKYGAGVIEGLGTKNLVADEYGDPDGRSYYDQVAQDVAAMIFNDLTVVGALPKVAFAHWSVGSSEWFNHPKRNEDLVQGFTGACDVVGATWGGGETPTLKDILMPGVMELSGSAFGEIRYKQNLVLGASLDHGDIIITLPSSGIHANGLTLARKVAGLLPDGYGTQLANGRTFGDALLEPTVLYVPAVRSLQEAGIVPSYMSNITGHGWRKIMRATQSFTYIIDSLPTPPEEFGLIQKVSQNSDEEMYGNFNMGSGYALFVRPELAEDALAALTETGFNPQLAGVVSRGVKRVILREKGITFAEDSLQLR